MKKILTLFMAIGLCGLFSCSDEGYDEQFNDLTQAQQQSDEKAALDSDEITELIVDPDSIPENFQTRAWTNMDKAGDLVSNMRAIAGMPFTLQNNGGAKKYLSSNGKGKECTLVTAVSAAQHKFYIKPSPQSTPTGNSLLIYSYQEKMPLTVGVSKGRNLLMTADKEEANTARVWSFRRANTEGSIVLENQGLFSTGGVWGGSLYFEILQINSDDKTIGYGKNEDKAAQKWVIKPDASFTIQDIEFVNASVAKVTPLSDVAVTKSYINYEARAYIWDTETFEKSVTEKSQFFPVKDIDWKIITSTKQFIRPSVFKGNLDLTPPVNTNPAKVKYTTALVQSTKKLIATENNSSFRVRPNTRLDVTYYYSAYQLEVDYEMPMKSGTATVMVRGTWKGTIYLDESKTPRTIETELDDWTRTPKVVPAADVMIVK